VWQGGGQAAADAAEADRLAGRSAACRIGMEASCGAHHLARRLLPCGHEVRLRSAQSVRPFVKTNKHDQADGEAIAGAGATGGGRGRTAVNFGRDEGAPFSVRIGLKARLRAGFGFVR
jgi:transposase